MIRRVILSVLALLAGSASAADQVKSEEQAVIVHFTYGKKDLGDIFALEAKLEKAISDAKVGEYDGNEVAADGSDGYLYMYGPNADKLWDTIKPILTATPWLKQAKVKLRYGKAGAETPSKTVDFP